MAGQFLSHNFTFNLEYFSKNDQNGITVKKLVENFINFLIQIFLHFPTDAKSKIAQWGILIYFRVMIL